MSPNADVLPRLYRDLAKDKKEQNKSEQKTRERELLDRFDRGKDERVPRSQEDAFAKTTAPPAREEVTSNTAAARAAVPSAAVPAPAAPPPPARSAAVQSEAAKAASVSERLAGSRQLRQSGVLSIEIVSPVSSSRWRVSVAGASDDTDVLGARRTAGVVERSTDGGSTWMMQPTGVPAQITAGASPSASVCWLVGRGGIVLVSNDGRTWQRRPFPEIADLTSIRATDARNATVTVADGRTFVTKDGGLTWAPSPLQEF